MDIKCSIKKNIGILSQRSNGWAKEVNLVQWFEKDDKFDIREWSPDHEKMSKGITMSEDELFRLYELLKDYFNEETVPRSNNTEIKDIQDVLFKSDRE